MKTNKQKNISSQRNRYTAQFKEQAIERARRDGVPRVAKDLGIAESILYNWLAKSRQTGQSFEEQKLQQAELARLKRENARLEEEVAFLKRRQRTLRSNLGEVRDDPSTRTSIFSRPHVSNVDGIAQWLLSMERALAVAAPASPREIIGRSETGL